MKPFIAAPTERDTDGDKLDDRLTARVSTARASATKSNATQADLTSAAKALESTSTVEVLFDRQITQAQIDAFIDAGGVIDHVLTRVGYGWTGSISADAAMDLPKLLGPSLLGVGESLEMELFTDNQGRNGRVRPTVWNSGIDGNANNVAANQITVAIIDTGLDASHTDLAGRSQYWFDSTADALVSPADVGHHGTHVAGIAVGTGAASGAAPSTINFTVHGKFPGTPGMFSPSPFVIPTSLGSYTWSQTARFDNAGGGRAALNQVIYDLGGGVATYPASGASSTVTPFSYSHAGAANPAGPGYANMYTPYASWDPTSADLSARYYSVTNTVTYAGVGDGWNVFRGAAPGAKYAGIKIFQNNGAGTGTDSVEGLDKLIEQSVTHKIKVANCSFGTLGSPGINTLTRAAVNTAAANGIVMVVAAGNDGLDGTLAGRQTDDPGRAQYAITVGATNAANQVTNYSSEGIAGTNDPATGEANMKPDLVAPGGSDQKGYVFSPDSNTLDSTTNGSGSIADAQANDYLPYKGTSMAAPYVAGAAALVIDALQRTGTTWDLANGANSLADVMKVKQILLMTATETNQVRETGTASGNPTLNRGSKDRQEGLGIINGDAAAEAHSNDVTGAAVNVTGNFGNGPYDRRAYCRRWQLLAGHQINLSLSVPAVGDYDLYLYEANPDPYGNPEILAASANAGNGVAESFSFVASTSQMAYIVVKRVSGGGLTAPDAWTVIGTRTDVTAPKVTGLTAMTDRVLRITFDEAMNAGALTAANYTVSGAGKGTLANNPNSVSFVSGTTYQLTWNSPQEMLNGATVTVTAANMGDAANIVIGVNNSASVTAVGTSPSVSSMTSVAPNPTNAAIPVSVTLSESSSNFAAADIASTNGTVSGFGGSGTAYSFTLNPSGQGTVSCVVNASTFTDAAGNANTTSSTLSRTYDSVVPTISLSSAAPNPTNVSIPVTVTLSESSSNFAAADIACTNGTASGFSGSGSSYSFTLNPSGQGTVSCAVNASTFTDAAGNANTASSTFSRTYDSVVPTVALGSVAPNPAVGAIPVTVTLSESSSNFIAGDITCTNGTVSGFSGSGSAYSFNLNPQTTGLDVSCQVTAGKFTDAAQNANSASNVLTRQTVAFPNAPSALSAAAAGPNAIDLTWTDNSSAETGIVIERRLASDVSYGVVTTLPANSVSYRDLALEPSTDYCYRVAAFNAVGPSPYADEVCEVTETVAEPDYYVGRVENPGGAGDRFGFAVSRLGKLRFAVGAPCATVDSHPKAGKVYVYTPPLTAPTLVIDNPNPAANSQFGHSLGFVGENLVVGAPGTTQTATGGAAYLINGLTTDVKFAFANPATTTGGRFGWSVSGIGTKQALIGAPGDEVTTCGYAHVFEASKTGLLVRSFLATAPAAGDNFGICVAGAKTGIGVVSLADACAVGQLDVLSVKKGTRVTIADALSVAESKGALIIGSPRFAECASGQAGKARIAKKGVVIRTIDSPHQGTSDGFGAGLAGGKTYSGVGAPLFDVIGAEDSGEVRMYSTKTEIILSNPSPGQNDQFGASMAQAGKSFVAIGAPGDDTAGADSGAVFLFNLAQP